MNIKEVLNRSIDELRLANVSEPEGSATLLLMDVLGKDRAYLYAHGDEKLSTSDLKKFKKYIERRKSHEPVWYILGEVEFYGRKFFINNNVMTPRPETEFLVKEILFKISDFQYPISNIIELGTGSGNIIITLFKELNCHPDSEVTEGEVSRDSSYAKQIQNDRIKFIATDISDRALKIARKNAKLHGVEKSIKFLHGDLLSPITNNKLRLSNTILVANLPYIPHEDMKSLQFDVLHHEPRVALDGGKDGLEIYKMLIRQMKNLNFSGTAFFEIGTGQGKLITNIVQKYFPKAKVEIKKDLADIDRIAKINIQ